jgi:trehalose 2-sulfotransferase
VNFLASGEPRSSIRLSYVICTTPRSGSNFLCEVLRTTGVAGRPDEYFRDPPAGHARWALPEFGAYVERIRRAGTTPNGVFGLKVMWSYFEEVVSRLATLTGRAGARAPEVLACTLPSLRYIWLTRRDKVRQGVSWERALKTRRWRSTDVAVEGIPEPTFDVEAIDALVEVAAADDRAWRGFFDRHGIEPLVILYEELEQHPEQTCRRALDFLRVAAPRQSPPPAWRHQRQADSLSEEWVRRYRALKASVPG